jgi:hypothetical protein
MTEGGGWNTKRSENFSMSMVGFEIFVAVSSDSKAKSCVRVR